MQCVSRQESLGNKESCHIRKVPRETIKFKIASEAEYNFELQVIARDFGK